MRNSNPIIAAAFAGILAQATPAMGQEDQTRALPFQTDVTQILNGTQGQIIQVDSISDLSEVAETGSSVVTEGNTGLSERALLELQEHINTHYAHLNILVYFAEDGGYSSNERKVCDSNDRLKVLKSGYYNNSISGGEGSHVILYLAGDHMDHPRRLTCALISPQMAELTGPDYEIFTRGQPLYDAVASKWRPDFDRIGAVHAFLEGLDELVKQSEADIVRQQLLYTQGVESIGTQLDAAQQMIVSRVEAGNINLDTSTLFQEFQRISEQARVLIAGEIQYIDESDKSEAERLLRNAETISAQIFSALENFDTYETKFTDYSTFASSFSSHPYRGELESDFSAFQVSLAIVLAKMESGNVDYILDVDELDDLSTNLLSTISFIDTTKSQLQDLETRIISTADNTGIGILQSSLYQNFQAIRAQVGELLIGGGNQNRSEIQRLLNDADNAHNQILSALTGVEEYEKRVNELQQYSEGFENHDYREELGTEFSTFQVSLGNVTKMISDNNIDFISHTEQLENNYKALTDGISAIDTRKNAIKASIGAGVALFMIILVMLNRRPGRLRSKDEFETELKDLKDALEVFKKIFEEEIRGDAKSIKAFFREQEGDTAKSIEDLKKSVAYISVLIPKIDEILEKISDSIGVGAILAQGPFDKGMKMLSETEYEINPLESDVDRDLLEMINGGKKIQDMSSLIDAMNQTLPALIDMLDDNTNITKGVIDDINKADENLGIEIDINKELEGELNQELELLKGVLHTNFYAYIDDKVSSIPEEFSTLRKSIDGFSHDMLKQFKFAKDFNVYIRHFISKIKSLREYIVTNNPLQNREGLALAGYDMVEYFDEMGKMFLDLIAKGLDFDIKKESSSKELTESYELIINEYELISQMNQAEERRKEILQKGSGIIAIRDSVGASIYRTLGELLSAEEIFIEGDSNTQKMYAGASGDLEKARECIQTKKLDEAQTFIEKAIATLDNIDKIITRTKAVADGYSSNVEGLTQSADSISGSIEDMQAKLDHLQDNFDASVLELRVSDFQADESDGDLSNNVMEIKQYLGSAQKLIDTAKTSTDDGFLLKTDKYLTEAFYLYEDANKRIKELTLSHDLITQTHTKNTVSFSGIVSKFGKVLDLSSTAHTTGKTQEFTQKLQNDLADITAHVGEDKPNPYDIEDLLIEFSDNTTQLEASIQRDQAEYQEYVEYSILAQEKWSGYKGLLSDVATDKYPDSNKVDKFVANADNIENELNKIGGYSDKRVTNWYKLTDRLEDIIKRCDHNTGFIYKESKERDNVTSAINTASREIKKAKRWSGRYVSISSTVGDGSLREAHRYYEAGEFGKALEAAKSAKATALRAVSNAEDADRREKRRREEEKRRREEARRAAARAAAASAARAASRSSSSSISFGGGGGGSGFSGGRM